MHYGMIYRQLPVTEKSQPIEPKSKKTERNIRPFDRDFLPSICMKEDISRICQWLAS
jgi:hypothetical protein